LRRAGQAQESAAESGQRKRLGWAELGTLINSDRNLDNSQGASQSKLAVFFRIEHFNAGFTEHAYVPVRYGQSLQFDASEFEWDVFSIARIPEPFTVGISLTDVPN
jgi:hypothetical protein